MARKVEPKASKVEANYRDGAAPRVCARCTQFIPPDACLHVAGKISPSAVCDWFVRAPRSDWYGTPKKKE